MILSFRGDWLPTPRWLFSAIGRMRPLSIAFLVIDVDGVLTDGTFLYDSKGKQMKAFGPDDADALQILRSVMEIIFVSADERGFAISRSRVNDMGFELNLVPSSQRLEWLTNHYPLERLAYIGDSFQDLSILRSVALGICPANGHPAAKRAANVVTKAKGGDRAVASSAEIVANLSGHFSIFPK